MLRLNSPKWDDGVYIFADPGQSDAPSAFRILSGGPSAGVVVGRRPHRRLLFFGLDWGWDRERVDFALNVLRAALGLHLLEERVRLSFRQVAEIQESLLREAPPQVLGFDVAYKSIPVEEVGGDFCDFVHLGEDLVGFASNATITLDRASNSSGPWTSGIATGSLVNGQALINEVPLTGTAARKH